MLIGLAFKGERCGNARQVITGVAERLSTRERNGRGPAVWADETLGMCFVPRGVPSLDEHPQPFLGVGGTAVMMSEGKIYNLPEIERRLGFSHRLAPSRSGEALLHLYRRG